MEEAILFGTLKYIDAIFIIHTTQPSQQRNPLVSKNFQHDKYPFPLRGQ